MNAILESWYIKVWGPSEPIKHNMNDLIQKLRTENNWNVGNNAMPGPVCTRIIFKPNKLTSILYFILYTFAAQKDRQTGNVQTLLTSTNITNKNHYNCYKCYFSCKNI